MSARLALSLLAGLLLGGCDQLGIPTPAATAAKHEADAKAIGAACRHAGRAIEDCYALNKKAEKAAIYTGWREMEEYMRENKLETIAPVIKPEPPPAPASAPAPKASAPEDADAEEEEDPPPAKGSRSAKR